jgi:hypothetical protein
MPFDELAGHCQETQPFGTGSQAPYWGVPRFTHNIKPLYARETGRHRPNNGELHTPAGTISFLERLTAAWKQCGTASRQIERDFHRHNYMCRAADILQMPREFIL